MKKWFAVLMAGLLAVTAAGCGGSGDKKTSDGKLDRSKQFITVLDRTYQRDLFPHRRRLLESRRGNGIQNIRYGHRGYG